MVSTVHEALRDLVRDDPNLCVELLAHLNVIDRAMIDEATCVDPTVRQNVSPSLSADVVVLLQRAHEARFVVIVEVQLEIDDDKNWSWPMYAAALRREHRCPAAVLAICPSHAVAEWARGKLEIGPSHTFSPIVLGPVEIPAIDDRERARERPALAVLSAIAHGNDRERGLAVVFAALSAVNTLEEAQARVYTSAIWETLDRVAQRALEVAMSEHTLPIETNFERRMREIFEEKWRRESEAKGRAEGEARGRAEGEAKGRAEGEEHGLVEGKRAGLRAVFAARGFSLDPRARERIDTCDNGAVLERWIARAVTAPTVDVVFEDDAR